LAKKNFSWDSEELLGVYPVSDKKQFEYKLCMLKDKEYVSVAEQRMTDEGWKYYGNKTLEMSVYRQLVAFMDNR